MVIVTNHGGYTWPATIFLRCLPGRPLTFKIVLTRLLVGYWFLAEYDGWSMDEPVKRLEDSVQQSWLIADSVEY